LDLNQQPQEEARIDARLLVIDFPIKGSMAAASASPRRQVDRLDVLVNTAGIVLGRSSPPSEQSMDDFKAVRLQFLRKRSRNEQTTNKFSSEIRQRAMRMVLDHEAECPSWWAAIASIASKISWSPATLQIAFGCSRRRSYTTPMEFKMSDKKTIDRRRLLKLTSIGTAGGLVATRASADNYPAPSSVDTGRVEDGKVKFDPWRSPADTPSPSDRDSRLSSCLDGRKGGSRRSRRGTRR
jgi:hypothetical protein